ncbi:MAG: sugar ABC transporter ATP-binding protein [Chloroflexi bacterium]|nr:sugar ABC transporter ATP-binding protein [Chloroflexota bacterium]
MTLAGNGPVLTGSGLDPLPVAAVLATPSPVVTPDGVPALAALDVHRSFGAVRALRGVSLSVARGEILGLVGANGAGKSTLIRILTGDLAPDAGEVRIAGEPVHLTSVRDAQALGIGVVRQELDLVPDLTVAENLFLGEEHRFPGSTWRLDRASMARAAAPLLDAVGLRLDPARRVSALSIGDRQLVAAARALRDAASVMLLDEPTSSLTPWETERLFTTLRGLATRGVAIIYISHRLDEIGALCDRVTVIRDGMHVGDFGAPAAELDAIVAAMTPGIGDRDAPAEPRDLRQRGEPVLEARGLRVGRHGPADLVLHRGEILGVFGLVGAGRSTIARALTGSLRPDAGEVVVRGEAVRLRSPWDGYREGVAYLAEDRKAESILPGLSIRINVGVRAPGDTARGGVLDMARLRALARRTIDRLAIKTPTDTALIEQLSGGNQQKVVVGRLLAERLDVLVLDEPTHGIDVKAKRELLDLLRDLAAEGKGILLISSELAELVAVADRIVVFRNGRVVAEFDTADATETSLVGAAAGRGHAA